MTGAKPAARRCSLQRESGREGESEREKEGESCVPRLPRRACNGMPRIHHGNRVDLSTEKRLRGEAQTQRQRGTDAETERHRRRDRETEGDLRPDHTRSVELRHRRRQQGVLACRWGVGRCADVTPSGRAHGVLL